MSNNISNSSLESLLSLAEKVRQEKVGLSSEETNFDSDLIAKIKESDPELFKDPADNKKNLKLLLKWLQATEESSDSKPFKKIKFSTTSLFFLVVVLAIILGLSSAAVIFNYDGKEAVNIALPIISFVLFPLIILFFNILFLLPQKLISKIPIINKILSLFLYLSPSRLLSSSFPKLSIDKNLTSENNYSLDLGIPYKIWKWFFLNLNQIFAAIFFITVLVFFIFQISIKDFAFAWGSTLNIPADKIFCITEALSLPWKNFLPEGRPSLELIEQTRLYRLAPSATSQAHAKSFGNWWYFIALSIFTYGLLPRVLLLCFTRPYKNRLIKKHHLKIPGLSQLLFRLKEEQISIEANEGAERVNPLEVNKQSAKKDLSLPELNAKKDLFIISWNFVLSDNQKNFTKENISNQKILDEKNYFNLLLGGSSDNFEEHFAEVKKISSKTQSALVLIRAWEIPLVETLEKFKELSKGFKLNSPLQVLLVDPSSGEIFEPATTKQNSIWARKIKSLDANLVICSLRSLNEKTQTKLTPTTTTPPPKEDLEKNTPIKKTDV